MVEKTQNETPVRHIETLPVSSHHVSTLGERQEESGGSRRKLTRQVTSKLLQLKCEYCSTVSYPGVGGRVVLGGGL